MWAMAMGELPTQPYLPKVPLNLKQIGKGTIVIQHNHMNALLSTEMEALAL